jgi:hypothetical protein
MFICITFVHALKITKCFIPLEITTLIVVKVFAGQLQNIYTSHLFLKKQVIFTMGLSYTMGEKHEISVSGF